MRKVLLFTTLSLCGLALPEPLQGAVIYRSNEGWSIEGDDSNQVESSAAEQMKKAEELEAQGDLKGALNGYRGLVKRYSLSLLAPKAQRKVGILLDRTGDYDKAYQAFDTYLTKYPRGDDFESVVESMFNIAKLFLEGQKKKVFGVPFAPSMARAQEMFEGIVKRAPYSKWAPLAQFNIGQANEKQGKYPEALAAYQQVVVRYPTDAIADDAQYQIGYVRLREHQQGSYDRASAAKAREAFEDFINRYPESEKVAQARENMKSLEGSQTKGTMDIARFYDRTKNYKAAVIYYNDVIKNQPGSAESEAAKARIDALKERFGEDTLRAGPERAETGAKAQTRRKLQAQVDTTSRPDYAGPPVKEPVPDEVAPSNRPRLRTSAGNLGPVPAVEPPLPEALPADTDLPAPQP
ncbi:MAG TPA: outer membrane protein assembly factor BamD [Chthoniobacteraceae bacterium]|jgi:outer membrane protein assembly factor BamD